jgi:hypothetical protein
MSCAWHPRILQDVAQQRTAEDQNDKTIVTFGRAFEEAVSTHRQIGKIQFLRNSGFRPHNGTKM